MTVTRARERGKPLDRSVLWSSASVAAAVKRIGNVGRLQYQDRDHGPAKRPGLVDEASWQRAMAVLAHPDRHRWGFTSAKHLLSTSPNAGSAEAGCRLS